MTICAAEIGMPWMCLVAHSWPSHTQAQSYVDPHICFLTSSIMSDMQVNDKFSFSKFFKEHFLTFTSPTYTNFQPRSAVRTARSMSSTVVRSFHPPASSIAEILQTPAVPGRLLLSVLIYMLELYIWWNRLYHWSQKMSTLQTQPLAQTWNGSPGTFPGILSVNIHQN
jgi:hypothetical protein